MVGGDGEEIGAGGTAWVVGGSTVGGVVVRIGGGTTAVGTDMERLAGWVEGVGGPELDGDGEGSVIHILRLKLSAIRAFISGGSMNEGKPLAAIGGVPMSLRRNKFRDCMCQRGQRIDMEYWKGVFALQNSACGEDNGYEVNTRLAE